MGRMGRAVVLPQFEAHWPNSTALLHFGLPCLVQPASIRETPLFCSVASRGRLLVLEGRHPSRMKQDSKGAPSSPPSSEMNEQEIEIYLKVIKTVPVMVKPTESIKTLKEKLRSMEGIASNLQALFFHGNHMTNDKTLSDYNVSDCSILSLFVSSEVLIPVSINIPPRGTPPMTVELKQWSTVRTIKTKIWEEKGIPLDRQTLIYMGKTLPDDQNVAACNIRKNSVIHMILRPRDEFQVLVNMPSGKTIRLEVGFWYSVWNVKTLIESMEQIPPYQQNIFHTGRQLNDTKTLLEYKLTNGSNLQLRMRRYTMQILVRTWSGKTITLQVKGDDSIEPVKAKILSKMKIKESVRFALLFAGKILTDTHTLESYGVQGGSTLHMCSYIGCA